MARTSASKAANNGDVTKEVGHRADVAIGGVYRRRADLRGTQIPAGSQELQPAIYSSELWQLKSDQRRTPSDAMKILRQRTTGK